ncbi:nuclease domain-containing protein [Pseudomonas luteola]|uniref:nuclease domain-containing protein n=1 Tax=Pseudomonas luteola TaxID=47886 RepID=UPI003A8B2651
MKIVSKKLRDSARNQDCTLRLDGCRFSPEFTVLCHLPVGMKGVGLKSPDLFAVFGCDHCHAVIDGRAQGHYTEADLLRALAETQMIWVRMGLLKIQGVAA